MSRDADEVARKERRTLAKAIGSIKRISRGTSFFQLTRLIYRLQSQVWRQGQRSPELADLVAFTSQVSMTFPTADVSHLAWPLPPAAPRRATPERLPEVEVAVMGLAGHLGPLPDLYTALIADQTRDRQYALKAFLDLFNHRLLCLFYEAWEASRPWLVRERGEQDLLTQISASLAGLGSEEARESLPVRGEILLKYAASLIQRPVSSEILRSILADHLGEIPFDIKEFEGSWAQIDPSSMTQFNATSPPQLGSACVLGRRFWEAQGRIAVRLGPLSYPDYLTVLPGGARAVDIERLVKLLAGSHLTVTTQAVLNRKEISGARLCRSPSQNGRLSQSAWLGRPEGEGRLSVRLGAGNGRRVSEDV